MYNLLEVWARFCYSILLLKVMSGFDNVILENKTGKL